MKRRGILTLIVILCLLTGCTVESKRIYAICKVDEDGTIYCYNDDHDFFYIYDGKPVKISGVGLNPYPALMVSPSLGEYTFEYILPGKYSGTLRDVNHYVHELLKDTDASMKYRYRDCYIVDVVVSSSAGITRIVYNKSGNVRIYFTDISGNSTKPLYISEE